jgi:hypothetical protein
MRCATRSDSPPPRRLRLPPTPPAPPTPTDDAGAADAGAGADSGESVRRILWLHASVHEATSRRTKLQPGTGATQASKDAAKQPATQQAVGGEIDASGAMQAAVMT